MHNIVYFEKYVKTLNSKAYTTYTKMCGMLNVKPTIFCDASAVVFDNSIPVFHSYYLQQLYNLTYIITDKFGLDYIGDTINGKIIVIYDNDTDMSVPDRDNMLLYNINNDLDNFIRENLYEI